LLTLKTILEYFILRGHIEISNSISILFFNIHWYAIFIAGALFTLIYLVDKYKDQNKYLKKINFDEVSIYAIPPALIGARIWHIIERWDYFKDNTGEILRVWEGGIGIYGAIIGAMFGIFIFTRKYKKDFSRVLNIIFLFLPLSQIIGRYGNLINQELYGPPTTLPWGIFIRVGNRVAEYINSEFFHPAYLYEQIGNLILLVVNFFLYKKYKLSNSIFIGSWFLGYGLIRFIVEFFKISEKILFFFSINQIASIIFIIAGILIIAKNLKNAE